MLDFFITEILVGVWDFICVTTKTKSSFGLLLAFFIVATVFAFMVFAL